MPHSSIDVIKPLERSFETVRKVLFQPFDLTKWLAIGFCAFLANVAWSGASFSYNGSDHEGGFQAMPDVPDVLQAIGIALLVVLVVMFIVVMIVLLWVSCRGRFMFIDCIVRNRGAIKDPWSEYRAEGDRLFVFHLILAAVLFVLALLAVGGVMLVYLASDAGWGDEPAPPGAHPFVRR